VNGQVNGEVNDEGEWAGVQRDDLFVVPLTPASMVPNTVTPLPLPGVDALPPLAAEPVPAQPDTSAPMAITNTAAMNGFTGNSKMVEG
jgi:hypothetical protein